METKSSEEILEKLHQKHFPSYFAPSLYEHHSLRRRNDDDDHPATSLSIYGDTFKGKEITVPKNTFLAFRDCKFENCTFIIRS